MMADLQTEHDLHRRRRSRNLGVLGALLAFAVLIFAVTIVKIGQGPGSVGNPSAAQGGSWGSALIEWARP